MSRKNTNSVKDVVIIGAGTSADVVWDILMDSKEANVVGMIGKREFPNYFNINILAETDNHFFESNRQIECFHYIIAVGNNKLKGEKYREYKQKGLPFINAIHKTANIDRGVKIGENNVIGAYTQIGTGSNVGNSNWIGSHANIDHHNIIGDNNLLAPGLCLAGSVKVGINCIIGINVSVNKNISIGDNVTIVSGKTILRNVMNNEVIKSKEVR